MPGFDERPAQALGRALGGAWHVAALPVDDIVALQRYGVDGARQLHLPDHVFVAAEGDLRAGEIELPHTAEALVIELANLGPVGLEAVPPGAQRLGVVQTQYLDIGDPEPRLFDRRQHLGERRRIAAGDAVFADPRVGHAR